jgi:uncharacterized protein YndB with AHSA1/START domain
MSDVRVQVEIDARPSTVWETIMDPNRLADWVTIHRSVEVKSSDPTCAGARMDQVLSLRGVSFKVHWTLQRVVPQRRAEWIGRGPALSKAAITYELAGPADGPTTFAYTNSFTAPGGPLGAVASRVVVGHGPEREAQESLQRLKRLLEGH